MPSIFFGFSGGGAGGSSFFFGTTYGPVSLCGPPAAGGVSCWFGLVGAGFAGGCLLLSWAAAGRATPMANIKAKAIKVNLLEEVTNVRISPHCRKNMWKSSKKPVLV